ncbi:MAG TPA: gamma-glutamylcyclotransferase family protein [Candidatus Angelobacter sp.]|nr:gamma-glutamylcyclotransferase family protein [Candidatus Angelobacter sp.]
MSNILRSRVLAVIGIFGLLLMFRASWGLRWSPEYLTAWGTFLTGIGTMIVALGAAYAAYAAISEYREKTQIEKTKWLSDLFKQFFIDRTFKPIRQKIDFNEMDDIRELLTREIAWHLHSTPEVFSQPEKDLLDEFTDYLNFLEFVGLLRKMGRLTDQDIESLFDYYIRRFVEVDSDNKIRRYLRYLGFENLNHLLNRVSPYLFVYGTLKKGGVRHELITRAGLTFVGNAKTRGRLYSLFEKDYPAAIFASDPSYVFGELYRIKDDYTHEWLNDLDEEEEVDKGLYTRILSQVEIGSKIENAWVYSYMQVVDESLRIESGIFSSAVAKAEEAQ